MQRRWWWAAALVVLGTVVGCGPNVSEKELGEIVYEMPQFPKVPCDGLTPQTMAPGDATPAANAPVDPPK